MAITHVTHEFNAILLLTCFPKVWNVSKVTMISECGKNQTQITYIIQACKSGTHRLKGVRKTTPFRDITIYSGK